MASDGVTMLSPARADTGITKVGVTPIEVR